MRTDRRQTKRGGFTSMELAMTLPILLMLLFGLFEFSLLFFARGAVVEASRQGARAATFPGTTESFIERTVGTALGPELARHARVKIHQGEFAGDPCAVQVRVPMQSASPDLLWPVGFSLKGQYLKAETVMRKE